MGLLWRLSPLSAIKATEKYLQHSHGRQSRWTISVGLRRRGLWLQMMRLLVAVMLYSLSRDFCQDANTHWPLCRYLFYSKMLHVATKVFSFSGCEINTVYTKECKLEAVEVSTRSIVNAQLYIIDDADVQAPGKVSVSATDGISARQEQILGNSWSRLCPAKSSRVHIAPSLSNHFRDPLLYDMDMRKALLQSQEPGKWRGWFYKLDADDLMLLDCGRRVRPGRRRWFTIFNLSLVFLPPDGLAWLWNLATTMALLYLLTSAVIRAAWKHIVSLWLKLQGRRFRIGGITSMGKPLKGIMLIMTCGFSKPSSVLCTTSRMVGNFLVSRIQSLIVWWLYTKTSCPCTRQGLQRDQLTSSLTEFRPSDLYKTYKLAISCTAIMAIRIILLLHKFPYIVFINKISDGF